MDLNGLTKEQKVSKAYATYVALNDLNQSSGYSRRLINNNNMYSGIENRQWNNKKVQELADAGMQITTINYTQKEVKRKTGLLLDNPVTTKYFARGGKFSDQTNVMQDLFDYNFNRGQWDRQIKSQIRDGNIMVGFTKMFWDFTNDREFGDVGLKHINPKFVKYNQNWCTDDFRDNKEITEEYWMTPEEIMGSFNINKEEFKSFVNEKKEFSQLNDAESLESRLKRDVVSPYENEINGKYKVIEFHYMETEAIEKVIDKETNQKTLMAEVSEDILLKMQMGETNRYKIETDVVEVNKVFIWTPNIKGGYVLYDGLNPIQLGRLPYFIYAYDINCGEVQGVVDQIAGLNQTINKRESAITHHISTSANNNYMAEEMAFPNQSAKRRFKENVSKGGNVFDVAQDANKEGRIRLLERSPIPQDVVRSIDRSVEQLLDLANATDSIRGQGAGSHESATAFAKKRSSSLVADAMMEENYKKLRYDIAEAFYYACPQVYSGSERKLFMPDGREVVINQVNVDQRGRIVIVNDISNLPRYGFTIDMSKMGATKREENFALYMDMKKIVTNPLYQTELEAIMVDYMDISDAEKQRFKQLAEIQRNFQIAQMQSQTVQLQFGMQQAQMQMQQMNQQMNQQQGGFTGMPQEGDAVSIAKGAGMGDIPSGSGVAGRQTALNNAGGAPSDMTNR